MKNTENINYYAQNWLDELKKIKPIAAQPNKKEILYQLQIVERQKHFSFYIIPVSVSLLKNGSYGKFSPYRYNPKKTPEYLQTIDYGLMEKLHKISGRYGYTEILRCPLEGATGGKILAEILNTKRLIIEDENSEGKIKATLSVGKNRTAQLSWQVSENATQKLICTTKEGSNYTIATIPAWYVDVGQKCCGVLENEMGEAKLSLLLQSPAISPVDIAVVGEKLQEITKNVSLPKKLPKPKNITAAPIPQLHLKMAHVNTRRYFQYMPVAELSYKYYDKVIPYSDSSQNHTNHYVYKDKEVLNIKYDTKKQNEFVKMLEKNNLFHYKKFDVSIANQDIFMIDPDLSPDARYDQDEHLEAWQDFLNHRAQSLRDAGFVITSAEKFPLSLVSIIYPDEDWQASISANNDESWFDFEIGIYANGKKISLLPVLVNLLKKEKDILEDLDALDKNNENIVIALSKQEAISLPAARVKKILSYLKDLHEFADYSDKELKLTRASALSLMDLQDNLTWSGSEKWQELLAKQKNSTLAIKDVSQPQGLSVDLRHYQHDGLRWLNFLQENNFGGILADDMGLGKTIQTLALIMLAKEQQKLTTPIFIIAPTSVVFNWVKEIEKFTPSLKTLLLYGQERLKHFEKLAEYDIVLSTYALIARDQEKLAKINFYMIVLDEAQYIKNSSAKVTQSIYQLKSQHRLCLTGTPMENHLGELWSLFHFLMPGFLSSYKKFREFYRNPIEKSHNIERQQGLVRKIRPFILRRSKDDVLEELPEKTTIVKYVEFEQDQRDLYETIRLGVQHELMKNIAEKGLHKSQIAILDGLLKLRQVCCDPRLVKTKSTEQITSSAKLETLKVMLSEMVAENRRILIFSQFVEMIAIIEQECAAMQIATLKLTGESKNRDVLVRKFQEGKVPVFLISLRAGGTGLNLTAADTVIQYDPWWNPAVEQQALSRAHRMGQEKPVFIYKMIGKGSVEEKILNMQQKKQALADKLLANQDAIDTKLQIEDVNELFGEML
jgi:SNF2 family DNA or RNA helicase